ncbi:MAG: carbonic anhydrase family protein [Pseudomonadota bacterium]
MRNLIALFACSLVMPMASANDPVPAHGAPAPAASVPAGVKVETPSIKPAMPSIKPAIVSPAAQAAKEAEAEAELSAKIAARLAAMRANQVARAAAAAKARKAAEARHKEEAAAAPVAPVIKPYIGNHWSYEGETGPANWGRNPAWTQCATGSRQSPIDLRDGIKVDLEPIAFDYKPSSFNVTDNGHTIQVNVGPGNFVSLQNRSFELLQFHFHRPSEERINGKGFEMVVHMVHKDMEGKLAVVAVLLERGKAQNLIQTVWNNLPLEKNDTVEPTIVLDPAEILPARRDYFTYMGSLTTPPCSEGVLWLVMKEPVQASPGQMALFARLYPFNARPVQANSGRVVKESN